MFYLADKLQEKDENCFIISINFTWIKDWLLYVLRGEVREQEDCMHPYLLPFDFVSFWNGLD